MLSLTARKSRYVHRLDSPLAQPHLCFFRVGAILVGGSGLGKTDDGPACETSSSNEIHTGGAVQLSERLGLRSCTGRLAQLLAEAPLSYRSPKTAGISSWSRRYLARILVRAQAHTTSAENGD